MAQAAAPTGLRVQIGKVVVDAADTGAVTRAIADANARQHWDAVPNALNPWLLDPARVLAMIAAVAALPESARGRLDHRAILLRSPGLPVMTSSPTTPDSFAHLTRIEVSRSHGDAADIRLIMPLDCGQARQNTAAARQAVETASGDIASLEKARRTATGVALTKAIDDIAAARRARFLLSVTWRENAEADAACRPNDTEAKAGLAVAARAQRDFAVPTNGIE